MTEIERKIHNQFAHYGRNAREWLRKCALLLPHIERRQIWKKKGFFSIYEYAAKLAGMSRSSVDEALRVLKKIEDKPELKKVVELFGVQRVRPVASIATVETAEFWAEKAMSMSKNALETYVHDFQERFFPREEITDKLSANEVPGNTIGAEDTYFADGASPKNFGHVSMQLEPEILQKLLKLKGEGEWNSLMKKIIQEREEVLEQVKPKPVKTDSRHIPEKIKRHVLAKTNGQCAFPACVRPHTSLHHTQRFKLEKVHDPDRLVPLCTEHERIAHLGLIENEEFAPDLWQLRSDPDNNNWKRSIDDLVQLYR